MGLKEFIAGLFDGPVDVVSRAGLKPGDTLVAMDGEKFPNASAAYDHIKEAGLKHRPGFSVGHQAAIRHHGDAIGEAGFSNAMRKAVLHAIAAVEVEPVL